MVAVALEEDLPHCTDECLQVPVGEVVLGVGAAVVVELSVGSGVDVQADPGLRVSEIVGGGDVDEIVQIVAFDGFSGRVQSVDVSLLLDVVVSRFEVNLQVESRS